jgi:putative ABC transport system substrate-binding protein
MSYLQHHLPNHLRRLLVELAALSLSWFVLTGAAAQTAQNIAVLYPQLEEPYRSLLGKILQGIEQRATERVIPMAISTPAHTAEVAATLQSQNVRVLIALGRSGLRLVKQLQHKDAPAVGMLVGAVVTVSEADVDELIVATLAPDPAELLAHLGKFNPRIKRVFVVYDPSQNRWMLHLAKLAAAARGMELHAFEASDLRSAMQHYQNILASMDAHSDALWLPLDTVTVNDTIVLPFVLQEAWTRNLVVFSSNLEHVRRGALFALYPDELAVGHHLAELALLQLQSTKSRPGTVLSLKNALLAVNTRTAAHVGLDKASLQAGAQRVFPE